MLFATIVVSQKKHECPYEHPQVEQDNAVHTARTPTPRVAPSRKYPGEQQRGVRIGDII